MTLFLRYFT